MSVSFGSAQTNGLPLLLTTGLTLATAQLLHTFVAGSATPERVKVLLQNLDTAPHTVVVVLADTGATLTRSFSVVLPVGGSLFDVFGGFVDGTDQELICNGAATIKVYTDAASVVAAYARVDNQSTSIGTINQNVASGLVAAVQNANRFAFPAPGAGVGTATEVNANQMIARAGIIRNLKAKADTTVGGGATVTVAVRVNGVSSALSVTIAAAQTTVIQSDTDSVALAVGDLITFMVACDNAGAPAANFHAAAEYISQ
jgi:hypothetical protein